MSTAIACTSAAEIATLVVAPCPEQESRAIEIGVHLATGCDACWTAVRALRTITTRRRSLDPLIEAMARFARPEQWATLNSRHFFALHHARAPGRFLDLVLIEASKLARGPLREEPAVKAFATPILLFGRLARIQFNEREAGIALAKLHAERALVAAERSDEIEAERLLVAAARIENDLDTLAAAPVVNQAERVLARLRNDPEGQVEESILLLNNVPREELPCHQAEIYAELAQDLGLTSFIISACLKPARELLRWLQTSLDPAVRRHGLYRAAYVYAVLGHAAERPEITLVPGFLDAARDLAAAEELFEEHGSNELRLVRLVCLAKLFSLLHPDRSQEYKRQALAFARDVGIGESFEALMALEEESLSAATEGLTVH